MKAKYTDKQIIDRMKSLPSFQYIPGNLHIVAIQSKEDRFNEFDDKLYLFDGVVGDIVTTCTTHPGGPALLGGWKKYTKDGAAIIKTDEIYYDAFHASGIKGPVGKIVRHHNDKIPCLRLIKKIKYWRDKNNDKKIDKTGPIWVDNYATNIHPNSYSFFDRIIEGVKKFIGEWSYGCIVIPEEEKYYYLYNRAKAYGKPITFTLLEEF